jgi:ABC-type dipeptide/oligopeptide/nickel transport system ATPase component
MAPSPANLPPGCAFRARCVRAAAACTQEPGLKAHGDRAVRCFYPL